MISFIKAKFKQLLLLLGIIGSLAIYGATQTQNPLGISEDRILSSEIIGATDGLLGAVGESYVKFDYITDEVVSGVKFKDNEQFSNTVLKNGGKTYQIFVGSALFYKEGNKALKIKKEATTTVEVWNKSIKKKKFGFINKAYAQTSYAVGSGNGRVSKDSSGTLQANWDTAHDATSGGAAAVTSPTFVGLHNDSTNFRFYRTFLPIDTSGIDDAATISSSSLHVYASTVWDYDNDGNDYLTVVKTYQASSTTLGVDDFNDCGSDTDSAGRAAYTPLEGIDTGSRLDLTSYSSGSWMSFLLNASGRAWIRATSTTWLGLRSGHDAADHVHNTGTGNLTAAEIHTSAGANPPYLLVDIASADTITLTEGYATGRIFQKNAAGTADIVASGTYSGTPTNIEARVVFDGTSVGAIDWQTIQTSPTGGTFSGTITGVPKNLSYYNVQVRYSNSTGVTDTSSYKIGVGSIYAVLGQSNMEYFFTRGSDLTATGSTKMYNGSGWQTNTGNGSIGFANQVAASSSCVIGMMDYGYSSTALTYQADTGSGDWITFTAHPYLTFHNDLDGIGGKLEAVIWQQGETDAGTSTDMEVMHETALSQFFSQVATDFIFPNGTTTLLSLVGRRTDVNGTDLGYQSVRNAQEDYCTASSTTCFIASTATDIGMADEVHYSAPGFTKLGLRYAQAALYAQDIATYYRGPYVSYYEQIHPALFELTIIHRGGNNFTSTTTSFTGFSILDDASDETITSASSTDADTIRIAISGAMTGTPTIRYLYGKNPTVTSVVYDNSNLILPLEGNDNIPTYTPPTYRLPSIIYR